MPQAQPMQGNTALAQPNSSDIKASQQAQAPLQTRKVNPLKEYVAGGTLSYLQDYIQALPPYNDDIARDFGIDIFERMLKDAQVTSAFESLRMAALSGGATFTGAVQNEKDTDFELSEEIRQFVERNLTKRLKQPFNQTCYDLLEGMAYGYKVAELVWDYEPGDTGSSPALPDAQGTQTVITSGQAKKEQQADKGKTYLKAIKVKPQRVTAFVVDAYLNVVAIAAIQPGQGGTPAITQGMIATPTPTSSQGAGSQLNPMWESLLPREKFCIFSFRPQDSDPRGTSILRPAYDPWWCKQQVKKDYLAYLARFASPSLIGFTPEDTTNFPVSDSFGNPELDNEGNQQYLSPEQAMGTALAGWKNAYYVVLTGGSKVQIAEATGNGEAFDKAFTFYNNEISKAIQYQTLATNEGMHQSRAASQTHADVKDMVIDFAKQALENCINQDVINNLVRYNWGDAIAQRLSPQISFANTSENKEFAADGGAVAQLYAAGFIHTSQLQGIDAKLQLPPRDMEEQLKEIAVQQQMQQKALEAKTNQQDQASQDKDKNQTGGNQNE